MEHISKAIQAGQSGLATNSTESQERTLSKTAFPISWVSAIFKKLQGRYGNKWISAIEGIEKEATQEWAEVLAGVTGEEVKRGLESWDGKWPPDAYEFRDACKGVKDWRLQSSAMTEPVRALPEPKEHRQKRRAFGAEAAKGLLSKLKGDRT